ncbi:MAG: glycosyltransferase [Chromatiales bacterium]|jgi:glycosyltransferase involved in cell wall biosynthesis|nr:glycosyltransferase [Chromatiales bacterium]MDX9765994.1 glycosyltransferase [Ectothiorhodospiraceae bacterium]
MVMDEMRERRLAVLVSYSGAGGVERMMTNLVTAFAADGQPLDLLLIRDDSEHLTALPSNVRVIRLGSRHALTTVPALVRYLRRARPSVLLAAKDRAGRAALIARALAGIDTRIVIRLGTHLGAALEARHPLSRWLRTAPMHLLYRHADAVIAVSEGVAADTARITGLAPGRIHVVRNPVVTATLQAGAAQPVPHPWLEASVPVILGIGRLTRQKDFPTLLHAFARLRAERPARLILLGEGHDRATLERQAAELGVAADVALPGFQSNVYAWLARARLFVLSSAWEGSPNALTEALALGIPVVATDCPSGPRELLQDGRIAPLVPVGDAGALAAAMRQVLDAPPSPDILRAAVTEYRADVAAGHYLEILRGNP